MKCSTCGRDNLSERELEIHNKYYHKLQPADKIASEPNFSAAQHFPVTSVGVCPDCGSTLWYEEGCVKCKGCGYTKC